MYKILYNTKQQHLPIKPDSLMSAFVARIISGSLDIGTQTSVEIAWKYKGHQCNTKDHGAL